MLKNGFYFAHRDFLVVYCRTDLETAERIVETQDFYLDDLKLEGEVGLVYHFWGNIKDIGDVLSLLRLGKEMFTHLLYWDSKAKRWVLRRIRNGSEKTESAADTTMGKGISGVHAENFLL
jgi:hypothetical protein